jgi:hypothetical protein
MHHPYPCMYAYMMKCSSGHSMRAFACCSTMPSRPPPLRAQQCDATRWVDRSTSGYPDRSLRSIDSLLTTRVVHTVSPIWRDTNKWSIDRRPGASQRIQRLQLSRLLSNPNYRLQHIILKLLYIDELHQQSKLIGKNG